MRRKSISNISITSHSNAVVDQNQMNKILQEEAQNDSITHMSSKKRNSLGFDRKESNNLPVYNKENQISVKKKNQKLDYDLTKLSYSGISRTLQQKNSKIYKQENKINELNMEIISLKIQLSEKQDKNKNQNNIELTLLHQQEQNNSQNILQLNKLKNGLQIMANKCQQTQYEKQIIQKKYENCFKENQQLTKIITQFKIDDIQNKDTHFKLNRTQNQFNLLKQQHDKCGQLIYKERQKCHQLEAKINSHLVQLNELQGQCNQYQLKFFLLQKQYNILKQHKKSLQDSKISIKQYKQQHEVVTKKTQILQKQRSEMQQKIQQLNEEIVGYNNQNSILMEQLRIVKEQYEVKNAEIQELKQQYYTLEQQYKIMRTQHLNRQISSRTYQEKFDELISENNRIRLKLRQIQNKDQQNIELQKQITKLQTILNEKQQYQKTIMTKIIYLQNNLKNVSGHEKQKQIYYHNTFRNQEQIIRKKQINLEQIKNQLKQYEIKIEENNQHQLELYSRLNESDQYRKKYEYSVMKIEQITQHMNKQVQDLYEQTEQQNKIKVQLELQLKIKKEQFEKIQNKNILLQKDLQNQCIYIQNIKNKLYQEQFEKINKIQSELREVVQNLNIERINVCKKNNQIQQLKIQLNLCKQNLYNVENQLKQNINKIQQYQNVQSKNTKEDLNVKNRQISELKAKLCHQSNQIQHQNIIINQCKGINNQLTQQVKNIEQKFLILKENYERLLSQKHIYENNIQQVQRKLSQRQHYYEVYSEQNYLQQIKKQQRLANVMIECNHKHSQIQQLQLQLRICNEKIQAFTQKQEQAKKQIKIKDDKILKMKQQLNYLNMKVQQTNKQQIIMMQSKKTYSKQLDSTRMTILILKQQNQKIQQIMNEQLEKRKIIIQELVDEKTSLYKELGKYNKI